MESEKIDTFVTQGLNVAFNTEIFVSHEREKWIILPIIDGKGYSAILWYFTRFHLFNKMIKRVTLKFKL